MSVLTSDSLGTQLGRQWARVCCYKGYNAQRIATGVSRATTEAVVLSSVLILAWDYFIGTVT
jgi:phospholipid/cholesterol/gamma-HCH transport system permease protein